ncbi:hypothetical protein LCM10_17030 [Rossellomorea aquimaris]|uniref:hypothetical protein n=1 Tax=Rossellomorea aquimaris TaxID=189382 RepID=UPI001CD7ADF0|nr:hypothetical protein [Rossellomorea aquimaris]MCA1056690.1 hypothetical protein [Rossellomorea aquimaris]
MNDRTNDQPEQINNDTKGIMDMHEEEQHVDAIPLEDLKKEQREEEENHHTKDDSSSEE